MAQVNDPETQSPLTQVCGTPIYVAPEIVLQSGYSTPCDLWSVGVVMFVMLTGEPPFYNPDKFQLFNLVMKAELPKNRPYWKTMSGSAKDLLERLLTKDPKKRITMDEIMNLSLIHI